MAYISSRSNDMPSLPIHRLGKNGPQVSAMGFGLMGLSVGYESGENRMKVLDRAYELEERFWDSADVYGGNEDLIGKWFKR